MNFIYFQFFIIIFSTLKESFVIGSVRYLSADSITGESSNLRDANKTNPSYSGSCFKREKDNKVACDPDVMFIGASKSGTSSLAHYLFQHPLIRNVLNVDKYDTNEAHFFDRGDKKMLKISEEKKQLEKIRKEMLYDQKGISFNDMEPYRPLLVEYTPNYLASEDIPLALTHLYDNKQLEKMKFIVCLREPVNRTVSSWLNKAAKHRDHHALQTSVDIGINQGICIEQCFGKRITTNINMLSNMNTTLNKNEHIALVNSDCSIQTCRRKYCSEIKNKEERKKCKNEPLLLAHVVKSMYSYQLLEWFQHFKRKQFFIFSLEEYIRDSIGTIERLLDFLGLSLYDEKGKYQ